MAEFITVNGKKISFMEREFIHGQTAEDMKENTNMTKSTEWAPTIGPMAKLTKVNGSMESNMEKLDLQTLRDAASWVSGKMESVLNG